MRHAFRPTTVAVPAVHGSPSEQVGRAAPHRKIEHARQMSPEERLLIAFELPDLCRELRQACAAKR
jgi:hypothetical protein